MNQYKDRVAKILLDRGVMSPIQHSAFTAYRDKNLFSLRIELLILLSVSIFMFCAGMGVVVYQNLDTIGHQAILAAIFLLAGFGFYMSFKNAKGFSRFEVAFDNPLYDYLVVLSTLLTSIFFGYLQYQYAILEGDYAYSALITAAVAIPVAYYFDNKTVLSLGAAALAAFVGISITPESLFNESFYTHAALKNYGVGLAVLLIGWAEFSEHNSLKPHFSPILLTFGQHLVALSCLFGLAGSYWLFYAVVLAAALFYFYQKSASSASLPMYVFVLLYGYFGATGIILKMVYLLDIDFIYSLMFMAGPVYLVGCIALFIQLIRKFNRDHDSE
jgi:hypothetical protein